VVFNHIEHVTGSEMSTSQGAMRVGFAGLGSMGSGVVRRLLDAGFPVTGWNRTKAKAEPLIADGMEWAETPAGLAERCDVVCTMLTDARAVEAVVDGLAPALRGDSIVVDFSTIAPDEGRALAERVAAAGATMLEAPVSGSLTTLAAGQLSIMVGGDRAAYNRVEPVLLAIGPKVTHMGASGSALLMKLAINLSLVVQGMSFCESIAMAERAGIEREAAVEAALKSVIASPMLAYRGPMILEGGQPETAFANVDLQQKDQQLGLRLGRELGAHLPFAALADQWLTACRAAGFVEEEWIAVYDVFRRMGEPA
jgi:3-hydroxyisobutyrate dehydrogenase-like beta-hydroxyacid dehydrogenase